MIISHVIGGLGNQMFQYAMGRALSLHSRQLHKLDISDFAAYRLHQGFELPRIFKANPSIATTSDIQGILGWQGSRMVKPLLLRAPFAQLRKKQFVIEPYFRYWPGVLTAVDNSYFRGYWQSEKYFGNYSEAIRDDFTFRHSLEGKNTVLAEQIAQTNAISLHVRRGDYVLNSKTKATHGICSIEYYQLALKYLLQRVESPFLFVFSDDIPWAMQHLKTGVPTEYVHHNHGAASYLDMQLMSLCKHHIIANSSFSWWGAWLNPDPAKIVIAPQEWFAAKIDTTDLIPAGWTRL